MGILAKSVMARSGLREPIFREVFSVDVAIWWRDKRSQIDCDGVLKLPLDALNGVVYSSDKFAWPRILRCDYDASRPRMEMVISCPPTNLMEFDS